MDRRHFLISSLAAAAVLSGPAAAATALAYEPGLVQRRLDAGETVFLDFKASWCGTCRAQGRHIEALKAENPAYGAHITFVDIDWDQYREAEITKRLNVPRRSTLIVLRGDAELGRLVAQTGRAQIKALMDLGLPAG